MRIGLSYDQGTPKYRLYRDALIEAAARFGHSVEPAWLASVGRAPDLAVIESLDGIVMTGGADVEPWRYGFEDPGGVCIYTLHERDEAELPILAAALDRGIPILAICRGMQLLNVACAGTLVPDLPGHEIPDELRHPVDVVPDSNLAAIVGRRGVASTSHHQAVDNPGNGLRIVARAPDGIVEAIEWTNPHERAWLAAVQWHPERMSLDEPLSGSLYCAFLSASADFYM